MLSERRLLSVILFLMLAFVIRLTLFTDTIRPTEFKVLVVGHVMAPVLYTATPETRVYELIIKSGGVDNTVDLSSINLASSIRSPLAVGAGKMKAILIIQSIARMK